MVSLCVNIDHVATIREARGTTEPDPMTAASICENAGAVGITFHLREDRRHIQDHDARAFRRIVKGLLNMEMACIDEMLGLAQEILPDQVTFVPEKREELTTEGGLDVRANFKKLKDATAILRDSGIAVSMFIEPDAEQVLASKECGASHVELHTGRYCDHFDRDRPVAWAELASLTEAAVFAGSEGLIVNAGHGLNYRNVSPIAQLPNMNELNIGHAIVGRAVYAGLDRAVRDMLHLIRHATPLTEDSW